MTAEPASSQPDSVEELHEQLQNSLRDLVTSDDWQKALAVAARFHDYSFANTRLIWAQSQAQGFTPSRVAGYRKWQQLDRHVKRGEHDLKILAPSSARSKPKPSKRTSTGRWGFESSNPVSGMSTTLSQPSNFPANADITSQSG